MPTIGIYFLPATAAVTENSLPSQVIFNALAAEHQLETLPGWTLDHRLFKETNLGANDPTSSPGYLQVLTISHHAGNSYLSISRPSPVKEESKAAPKSTSTIITVPTGLGSDEFSGMIATRFSPLWQRRQIVQVSNGQAYEAGSFVIRFGEVREAKTGQGGAQPIRGTVVEITTDDESESAAESIREFWTELDISGAKEYMKATGSDDGFGTVRKWLEAMRIRA